MSYTFRPSIISFPHYVRYKISAWTKSRKAFGRVLTYCDKQIWYSAEFGEHGRIRKSLNDGVSWRIATTASVPFAFALVPDKSTCDRLFSTSWGKGIIVVDSNRYTETIQPYPYLTALAQSTDTLYAGSDEGVYEAKIASVINNREGKNPWKRIEGDSPPQRVRSMLYSAGSLYVGTEGCKVYEWDNTEWKETTLVSQSTCGNAAVWSLAAYSTTTTTITFAGLDLALGVFKLVSSDSSWGRLPFFDGHTVLAIAVDQQKSVLYVSTDKGIYRCDISVMGSTDTESCSKFSEGLPEGVLAYGMGVGEKYVVIATENGFWYRSR